LNFGSHRLKISQDLVDFARLGLRTLPMAQMMIAGINISTIITNFELEMKAKVLNNLATADDSVMIKEEELKMTYNLALCIAPSVTSFICTQILLNSNIITSQINLFCFIGISLSNFANIYLIYRKISNDKRNSYLKLNFLFAILNLIFLSLYIKYIFGKKVQTIKREKDRDRLEDLDDKEKIINEDLKTLEDEIEFLYKNSSIQEIRKIEEIHEDLIK